MQTLYFLSNILFITSCKPNIKDCATQKIFLLFQICSSGKQVLCVNWESKNKQTDAKIVNCESHKYNIIKYMSTDVQTRTESITLRHIHNLCPVLLVHVSFMLLLLRHKTSIKYENISYQRSCFDHRSSACSQDPNKNIIWSLNLPELSEINTKFWVGSSYHILRLTWNNNKMKHLER